MAQPIIQSDQPAGAGLGTAGQGRNDLQLAGGQVNLSDVEAANAGASYVWEFEDIPIGSTAILNNPLTATPNFTPDVTGSYRVRCTVDGVDFSVEIFAVPLDNTGARIPSFDEQLEYDGGGNVVGWHEALTVFMRNMDVAAATPLSSYERQASFGVDIGLSTQEATLGRVTYSGSLIGLSVHAEEATTAGTLTVNVKVNGVTKLTTQLDTVDTESNFDLANVGDFTVANNDEISVEVVADASYDNTPSGLIGVVVNVALVDSTAALGNPNVSLLDAPQVYTAGQAVAQVTLTDGAGIVVDGDESNNFELELTQNSDLANPTNVRVGQVLNLAIRQDGTGGWTLSFGTAYKFAGGTPPTITAAALSEDIISCYVREVAAGVAVTMLCSSAQDFS